jgi:hypothetical protein
VLGNDSVDTFPRQRIHTTLEELWEACVCVCPLSLLGNSSVNTLPQQERIVGDVFCAVRVVSKESRGLVLLRTSCFLIGLCFLSRFTKIGIQTWGYWLPASVLHGGSDTTIRHNTQITHITQNNTTIKQNTTHKTT